MILNKLEGKTEKLLKVLGFLELDVQQYSDNTIDVAIDKQTLAHAILSTDEDIQYIYGNTEEWLELVKAIQ